MRKAFLQNDKRNDRGNNELRRERRVEPPRISTWEPERSELEVPLTKRQLKRRRNKNSKLAKKFKNLFTEINNLKSQIEGLENKITKASQSTNARFKRKKIRSMKREFGRIIEKLKESEKSLESIESRIPKNSTKQHPTNINKCIENKIAELNKKIRRAKNKRNRERLIAKRDSLRLELGWGPKQLDCAFGCAYRRYIDGIEGMDVDTFFSRTKKFFTDLLKKK